MNVATDIHPLWVLAIDYVLGMIMWTLIARAAMMLFMAPDSQFFFYRFFVRVTDPLINAFRFITPSFLLDPMVPLFVAWFFFMFRFYVMPWLLGYSVMGMLSFPFESDVTGLLHYYFN